MQPGELDKRIGFRLKDRTPDGGGGYEVALTVVADVWAKIVPLSTREKQAAMQAASQAEYEVFIRTRQDIHADMIVIYREVEFEIVDIPLPDPRQPFMSLKIAKAKMG